MSVAHQPLATIIGQLFGACILSKPETSASTACASSARAPLRKTSVSGSAKVPGCESWKTLASVTAYHSFGGEVEASNTPTIRRLTRRCASERRNGSAGRRCQTINSWRRSRRSSLSCQPTATGVPRHPQAPSVHGLLLDRRAGGTERRHDRRIAVDVRVSPCPDAKTVMRQLSAWINHYNEVHPPKALGYRSPREFIAAHGSP